MRGRGRGRERGGERERERERERESDQAAEPRADNHAHTHTCARAHLVHGKLLALHAHGVDAGGRLLGVDEVDGAREAGRRDGRPR